MKENEKYTGLNLKQNLLPDRRQILGALCSLSIAYNFTVAINDKLTSRIVAHIQYCAAMEYTWSVSYNFFK